MALILTPCSDKFEKPWMISDKLESVFGNSESFKDKEREFLLQLSTFTLATEKRIDQIRLSLI